MKPARLLKRLGAAIAMGLITLGIIAGTASAATASEINGTETATYTTSTSGEIT